MPEMFSSNDFDMLNKWNLDTLRLHFICFIHALKRSKYLISADYHTFKSTLFNVIRVVHINVVISQVLMNMILKDSLFAILLRMSIVFTYSIFFTHNTHTHTHAHTRVYTKINTHMN